MKRKNRSRNKPIKSNTIIRCKKKMIPVFETDTCKDFVKKPSKETNNICKNCAHSF